MSKLTSLLRRAPVLMSLAKKLYRVSGAVLSDRKTDAVFRKISPDGYECFFGYYDKSPWDASGERILFLRTKAPTWKNYVSTGPAEIVVKSLTSGAERVVAVTRCWNSQQGCMLQWRGPDFDREIIFNDFFDGAYQAVVLDIETGRRKNLPMPVYSVSEDGQTAVTLDFSRLNTFRPGYGYANIPDASASLRCPDSPAMWAMTIPGGEVRPLITYRELAAINHREDMDGAYHKVNHIMLNPAGTRLMFLHRWLHGNIKKDRLLTMGIGGDNIYVLLDEDMVSHSNWLDAETIVTFANTYANGPRYYILKDHTQDRTIFGDDKFLVDGHPSFSPDRRRLVTDTYPDFRRKQRIYIYDMEAGRTVMHAEVYQQLRYNDECRCDLHPRWRRDSGAVCIDGASGDGRAVYIWTCEENA